jgi:peptide subunit release factor 1 (eRF1)
MTHLPDLKSTYAGLRRFDCQRCGHAFMSRQPRIGCPACNAPIDMVTRSEVIDYGDEGLQVQRKTPRDVVDS